MQVIYLLSPHRCYGNGFRSYFRFRYLPMHSLHVAPAECVRVCVCVYVALHTCLWFGRFIALRCRQEGAWSRPYLCRSAWRCIVCVAKVASLRLVRCSICTKLYVASSVGVCCHWPTVSSVVVRFIRQFNISWKGNSSYNGKKLRPSLAQDVTFKWTALFRRSSKAIA